MTSAHREESQRIKTRYRERQIDSDPRYSLFDTSYLMTVQEKERQIVQLLKDVKLDDVASRQILDIGCGQGKLIRFLLELGFSSFQITANDLLEERLAIARSRLPKDIHFIAGDASELELPNESFDIISQSLVFSSILDRQVREFLAQKMWLWLKPGGAVLWYDFVFNNPSNKDVSAVPMAEVRQLFPGARIIARSVTLAPPISRAVVKLHPSLHTFFSGFPFLRTHRLCWIQKV
jgi:ubiquinone/menaquinone biosynthesis C-methylase UbiE